MSRTDAKEIRNWVSLAQQHGWRVRYGKHIIVYPVNKDVDPVVLHVSGGGGRGTQNALAQLRRSGLPV